MKEINMTFFKIRNENGLFSTGGKSPVFNSKGKLWNSLGHLKNHLILVSRNKRNLYKNADIVSYELFADRSVSVKSTRENFSSLSETFTPDKFALAQSIDAEKAAKNAAEDAQLLAHQDRFFAEFEAEQEAKLRGQPVAASKSEEIPW